MSLRQWRLAYAGLCAACCLPLMAQAQSVGFDNKTNGPPVPIQITASQGIEWNQKLLTVTASGNAKAVRGPVTVTSRELVAHYKKNQTSVGKTPASAPVAGAAPAANPAASPGFDTGSSTITELDAIGDVHISTATDNAFGDLAIYHMASGELDLTGKALKLTTPNDVITARDAIKYFAPEHKAEALGDALVVAKDGRSIEADTLIAYTTPGSSPPSNAASANPASDPLLQSGKLKKVIAIGHVIIRTASDIITGDHGEYTPDNGDAVVTGDVHITRGENQLDGSYATVNLKTGIATLHAAPGGRVSGYVVPNSAPGAAPSAPAASSK
ncbi:MAG: hypothetical protein B7Z78_09235 [Rhodospirillales bacterium 20-60-12]|nr:MAG: hypothetical protein B7Z78_09235 [Rhodospirillales bacterium 20-60-12]HQT67434.1 LptA/OstA family protein [Acetobacteraceae bacterium]HQU02810.1 LptA/OstA family protein [Acetobacteraceae bacterium]